MIWWVFSFILDSQNSKITFYRFNLPQGQQCPVAGGGDMLRLPDSFHARDYLKYRILRANFASF
jgi:hypothetical protein